MAREKGWTKLLFGGPPQHGKTTSISEIGSSLYKGHFPDHPIIMTAYSDPRAQKYSRRCRNLVTSDAYKLLFPKIKVIGDSKAAVGNWTLEEPYDRGEVTAAGIMGGVTGNAAKLLIIDDPIKNRQEAESKIYQDRLQDEYKSTLTTRVHEDGIVWAIMTRWNDRDFGHYLINECGYKYIRLAAIAEEDDPLKRRIHQALWPERFSYGFLKEKKKEIGEYVFTAMYQGKPAPKKGLLFDRDTLENSIIEPEDVPKGLRWARYWDLATSTKNEGCFTVGLQGTSTEDGTVILDGCIRGKWEWPQVRDVIKETAKLEPEVLCGVEAQGTQQGMVQELWQDSELVSIGIIGVPVSTDKRIRAIPLMTKSMSGKLKIVRGEWNSAFIEELVSFDKGEYDDQVDAASGVLKLVGMINVGTAYALEDFADGEEKTDHENVPIEVLQPAVPIDEMTSEQLDEYIANMNVLEEDEDEEAVMTSWGEKEKLSTNAYALEDY
jgi:predicted phage terminase large subunit-like protein